MDEHSMEMDLYGAIFEGTDYGDQIESDVTLDLTNITLANKNPRKMQQNMAKADVANIKTKLNNLVVDGEF